MRSIEEIKADIEKCSVIGAQKQLDGFWLEWFRAVASGVEPDRLETICAAEKDGRCVVLPCKRGDACFEIGSGHGIIRHTVKGITVYNRGADGQRYLNDINNSIVIDTWAVGDDGCEWPDHYTPEEWEKAPKTRAEAEAALAKEKDGQK